jgi:N-acetylmuramoyl-L-alanine amidase
MRSIRNPAPTYTHSSTFTQQAIKKWVKYILLSATIYAGFFFFFVFFLFADHDDSDDHRMDAPFLALQEEIQHDKSVKSELAVFPDYSAYSIIIDPGHGGKDPGCKNEKQHILEKDVVLAVSKELEAAFKRENPSLEVVMIRTEDVFVSLADRIHKAEAVLQQNKKGILISIHFNAHTLESVHGIETYYYGYNPRVYMQYQRTTSDPILPFRTLKELMGFHSYKLASYVQSALCTDLPPQHNRGLRTSELAVLQHPQMPAILCELGFLTNLKELRKITRSIYQKKLAEKIVHGTLAYIEWVEHRSN